MNKSFCEKCKKLVATHPVERDGKVYLVKECSECGATEALISSDSERYFTKRSLDAGYTHDHCELNCLTCRHPRVPSFIFIDITNRCNLNCPICINNTPSMGFLFEPPMEYFEKIFRKLSTFEPRPAVQLFGGEPTVRDDLFDMIKLAKSHGLPVRVVTNGMKLANEEYCRELVQTRATILIAYDGRNPETYRVLRGNASVLKAKIKAMENLRKAGRAKVALMTCVAKGFNDNEITDLLQTCHEWRDVVRGVYFMPLAHTWDAKDFKLEPDRMTTEEIEMLLNRSFPGERIEFLPAGVFGSLPTLMRCLRIKPPPFAGAHPNCESMYFLISDGEKYVPAARYLKRPIPEAIRDLLELEKRLAQRVRAFESGRFARMLSAVGLKNAYLGAMGLRAVAGAYRRNVRTDRMFQGGKFGKYWHAMLFLLGLLFGRRTSPLLKRHTRVQGEIQLIVLPFEDTHVMETDRLERCPNAFAFVDPRDDEVRTVPVCAWGLHKKEAMRLVTEHYAKK